MHTSMEFWVVVCFLFHDCKSMAEYALHLLNSDRNFTIYLCRNVCSHMSTAWSVCARGVVLLFVP